MTPALLYSISEQSSEGSPT